MSEFDLKKAIDKVVYYYFNGLSVNKAISKVLQEINNKNDLENFQNKI